MGSVTAWLGAGFDALSAAATRIVGGEPLFERRARPNQPRCVTNDALDRRQRRQPWLAALFVLLLAAGWFYPIISMVGVLAMLAGAIGLGLLKGRYWCNYLCPRGSFFDSVLRRFSRGAEAPAFFHHPLFRLGWMAWFTVVVVRGMLAAWGDLTGMSAPFVRLMLMSTGIAVVLGVTFHERSWCMFCPMGTMGNVANRLAKLFGRSVEPQVTVDAEACVDCLRCHSACRQQIEPNEYKRDEVVDHGDALNMTAGLGGGRRELTTEAVDHGDCLKCGYCVEECPTGALAFEGAAPFGER